MPKRLGFQTNHRGKKETYEKMLSVFEIGYAEKHTPWSPYKISIIRYPIHVPKVLETIYHPKGIGIRIWGRRGDSPQSTIGSTG